MPAIHFEPQDIRDHFEGGSTGTDPTEGVSSDALRQAADEELGNNDELWEAFGWACDNIALRASQLDKEWGDAGTS